MAARVRSGTLFDGVCDPNALHQAYNERLTYSDRTLTIRLCPFAIATSTTPIRKTIPDKYNLMAVCARSDTPVYGVHASGSNLFTPRAA